MLNISNHQGNANQNHNEISLNSSENDRNTTLLVGLQTNTTSAESNGDTSKRYNKFEEGDSSGFWRESNNDHEDNQTRSKGFSKRGGYQAGNDSEASGPSRRGGRGSFRGCHGGFGLGRPNNEFDQDEGMQPTSGLFSSRRPALSGKGNGDTSQSQSGSGSGRGGYKGLNEEVITGSGKNSWKSEAEGGESGDIQGPKVTYGEDSIFAHYQTGINFDKYETILVEVLGHDAPPAILTFEEANLCQTLNNNIAKAGYTKLTPAQTGSGKTAAFLLPILAHMTRDGITASRFKELQEPECIIVAPTRELINQIYLEARKFSFGTCVRAVVIHGGTQLGHSIQQIVQGCNILCATPGRLMDITGKEKIGLRQIKYLVLDKADRMLDMGMPSKEEHQTLMFSATFPEEIQRLAGEFLKLNYLFVAVGQVGGACRDVQQTILQVGQYSKREKLVEILQNTGGERTMVFVETKKKADFIATFLCQEKISTTSIHGSREREREREQALGDIRCEKCPVLVATSVAAKGLDIGNVQHPLVKVLSDAQQDVPGWLEEIAFNTYVPGFSGGSTRGNMFASVDTRKNYQGKSTLNTTGFSSSQASNPVDDESWD
uniref:RNA helicase n=1 Tax=Microcebus murinus TaxID=30608 RepID=A0A8C5XV32_MICMU